MKFTIFKNLIILFSCSFGLVLANIRINSFKSDIFIEKNGEVSVKEEILFYLKDEKFDSLDDFETRHYQSFKYRYNKFILNNSFYDKSFKVPYTIQRPDFYTINYENKDKKNPFFLIRYFVEYKNKNKIDFLSEYDQLILNIVESNWKYSIDEFFITINFSEKLDLKNNLRKSYSFLPNDQYSICINNNKIEIKSKNSLIGGSSLAFICEFEKDLFKEPVCLNKLYRSFTHDLNDSEWITFFTKFYHFFIVYLDYLKIFIILLWIFSILLSIYIHFKNRSKKNNEHFVNFSDYPPSFVAGFNQDYFDLDLFGADIIDLAVRGFIIIKEKKDGSFVLIKNNDISYSNIIPYYITLLDIFFEKEDMYFLPTNKDSLFEDYKYMEALSFCEKNIEKNRYNYFKGESFFNDFNFLLYLISAYIIVDYLGYGFNSIFSGIIIFFLFCFNLFFKKIKKYTAQGNSLNNSINSFVSFYKKNDSNQIDEFIQDIDDLLTTDQKKLAYLIAFNLHDKIVGQKIKDFLKAFILYED